MPHELPAGGLGFRPTFLLALSDPPAALVTRLRTRLDAGERGLETTWAGPHLLLALPRAERHFWSPWAFVDVRAAEADGGPDGGADGPPAEGATVQVRFSPHPHLWTAIALAYLALGCVALFAGSLGWAQVVLGTTQWAWAVLAASLVGAVLLWAAGQAGQRLARAQMDELWELLGTALAP